MREEDLEHYFNELRDHKRSLNTVARNTASVRGLFAYLLDEGHLHLIRARACTVVVADDRYPSP